MSDPTTFTNLVAMVISLIVMAAILRAIRAGDPVDLAAMFAHPWELDWPRGVQEEDLQPWRPELLRDRAGDATRPVELTRPATSPDDDAWDAAA